MNKVIATNSLFSVVLLFYKLARKQKGGFFSFIFTFFLPASGFVFLFFLWALTKIRPSGENKQMIESFSEEQSITGKGRLISPELGKTFDIIPFEEALMLSDSEFKRRMVIEAIKDNAIKHIRLLKGALRDKDTEISHYAAAAITEIKRKLSQSLQYLSASYEQNRSDVNILAPYADALEKYISSGLLDQKSCIKYKHIYSEVLKNLLSVYCEEEKYFIDKIHCDLDLGDCVSAKKYCAIFVSVFKESEKPFLMSLMLFYKLRDKKRFDETLNSLKQMPLELSKDASDIVEFWSEA